MQLITHHPILRNEIATINGLNIKSHSQCEKLLKANQNRLQSEMVVIANKL